MNKYYFMRVSERHKDEKDGKTILKTCLYEVKGNIETKYRKPDWMRNDELEAYCLAEMIAKDDWSPRGLTIISIKIPDWEKMEICHVEKNDEKVYQISANCRTKALESFINDEWYTPENETAKKVAKLFFETQDRFTELMEKSNLLEENEEDQQQNTNSEGLKGYIVTALFGMGSARAAEGTKGLFRNYYQREGESVQDFPHSVEVRNATLLAYSYPDQEGKLKYRTLKTPLTASFALHSWDEGYVEARNDVEAVEKFYKDEILYQDDYGD